MGMWPGEPTVTPRSKPTHKWAGMRDRQQQMKEVKPPAWSNLSACVYVHVRVYLVDYFTRVCYIFPQLLQPKVPLAYRRDNVHASAHTLV